MENGPVPAKADKHIRIGQLLVQIAQLYAMGQLKIPIHIKRKADARFHTAALQDPFCRQGSFETLIPVGIGA